MPTLRLGSPKPSTADPELATASVARTAWDANGAIIVVDSLEAAMPLVDRLAPEHLELAVDDPQALFDRLRHAARCSWAAIRRKPSAIMSPDRITSADGPPCAFRQRLSVLDFMKRTSFLGLTETALNELGPATVALAHAEGLRPTPSRWRCGCASIG